MLSLLLTLVVAQPQLPPLPQAPPLEQRVSDLERRVAVLEQPRSAPTAAAPRAYVIPAGYHAHRTVDGRTIVHSDALNGNAAAHAGIAPPWVKTATAGQTVYLSPGTAAVSTGATYYQSSGCPSGFCPAPQRRGLFGWR